MTDDRESTELYDPNMLDSLEGARTMKRVHTRNEAYRRIRTENGLPETPQDENWQVLGQKPMSRAEREVLKMQQQMSMGSSGKFSIPSDETFLNAAVTTTPADGDGANAVSQYTQKNQPLQQQGGGWSAYEDERARKNQQSMQIDL